MDYEQLYDKYEHLFKYAQSQLYHTLKYSIHKDYVQSNKLLDKLKEVSIDYDDIKQELYIELLSSLRVYEKKFKNEPGIDIKFHIRKLVKYVVFKALRNNSNKVFKPIDSFFVETDENEEMFHPPKISGAIVSPDVIPEGDTTKMLQSNDTKKFLLKCKEKSIISDIDTDILMLKLVENYTFDKIASILNIGTRQAIYKRYKRAIRDLKKVFSDKSQLVEFI